MKELLLIIVIYAWGSVSPGWLWVKAKTGQDLRTIGSGGIGATNASRFLRLWETAMVFGLDVLKGFLPVWLTAWLGYDWPVQYAVSLSVLIGHSLPVWLRFKGGKAVASGLGVMLALNWQLALIGLALFGVGCLPTGTVSIGSILAAALLPFISLLYGDLRLTVFVTLLGTLVIVLHKNNIKRLLRNEEPPRFYWRKVVAHLLMPNAMRTGRHFVFTIHTVGSTPQDAKRGAVCRFWWLRLLPASLSDKCLSHIPMWARFMGVSLGIKTTSEIPLLGWIHAVPEYTAPLVRPDHPRAQAALQSLTDGIQATLELVPPYVDRDQIVIGLGAATGIAGHNGHRVFQHFRETCVKVTNGNTLTAVVIFETLQRCIRVLDVNKWLKGLEPKIAVIGAAGSVGEKCCRLILREYSAVYLVDRPDAPPIRMKKLVEALEQEFPGKSIVVLKTREEAFAVCDLSISATNADSAGKLDETVFRRGHIAIDAGEPANLPLIKRLDVLVVKGGLTKAPGPWWAPGYGRMMNLPSGKLGYACLTETALHATGRTLMWDKNTPGDAYVGKSSLRLMDDLHKVYHEEGFTDPRLHDQSGKEISRIRRRLYLAARR